MTKTSEVYNHSKLFKPYFLYNKSKLSKNDGLYKKKYNNIFKYC